VVTLVDRVDRCRPKRLRLRRRLGLERRAVVAEDVPLACRELLLRPDPRSKAGLARARVAVLPLAVDRHGRGDEQLADPVAPLQRLLEDDGRADRVDRRAPLDLVHRLPDADGGREVDDRVDAVEGIPHRITVAHVAGLELHLRVEVVRRLAVRVHLRVEVVERAHLVAVGEEPVGEVRADEAGAAGDQDIHGAREATSAGLERG
jgi:hypothetical protein